MLFKIRKLSNNQKKDMEEFIESHSSNSPSSLKE